METMTITGMDRNTCQFQNAVTENTSSESHFCVCPRVVSVKPNVKTPRIPVRVCNISARPITIQPKSVVCDLHEVKAIRNIDPSFSNPDAEFQSIVTLEDLGINLPNDTLTKDQQEMTKDLVETYIFHTTYQFGFL